MANRIIIDNYVGKTSGNTTVNPHIIKNITASSLTIPSSTSWGEVDGANIATLNDNNFNTVTAGVNGQNPQTLLSFNLVAEVERKIGTIPANTTADKITWIKNNISRMYLRVYGYGQSPLGSKVYYTVFYNDTNAWAVDNYLYTSTASTSTLTTILLFDNLLRFIDANGFIHFNAYTDSASGTTDKILVLSSHGLSHGDFIENVTRSGAIRTVMNPVTNAFSLDNSITGQSVGDEINKYYNFKSAPTESGTTTSRIKITNHGLTGQYGVIKIPALNYATAKVTIVDANTLDLTTPITGLTSGLNTALYKFVGTQHADGTTSHQVTLSNHGLVNGDFIQNTTRGNFTSVNVDSINVLLYTGSWQGTQTVGDVIDKYHKIKMNQPTESGTTEAIIKITNHGITNRGAVYGSVTGWGQIKVTVVDANTLQLESAITGLTSGATLDLFQYTGTQTTEAGVASSTIHTDYAELQLIVDDATYHDTSYPTISSAFNTIEYTTNDNITIPYIITNTNGGVLSATYSIDGVTATVNNLLVGSNTWNVGQLSKGNHKLTIEVTNSASLKSNKLVFYIAIDTYSVPNYVKDGLVLDLNANDVSKTNQQYWFDRTVNGFIGSLQNFGYTTGSGWNNGALSFDGNNDYMSIPYDSKLNQSEFTIELYLRPTNTQNGTILSNYESVNGVINGYKIGIIGGGRWGVQYGQGTSTSNAYNSTLYATNTKIHLVVTYKNGVGFSVYADTKNIGSINSTFTFNTSTNMFVGAEGFKGDIYYTRMYNRTLSLSEIQQNYQNAVNTPSNLDLINNNGQVQLYWKDRTLESKQYKIRRNGSELATLNKNSILLKNELKIQKWVTSATNPMTDGGSLGTGHLYTTSAISKTALYSLQKFNSTHDISKDYATHGLVLYLDGKDGQGTQTKWLDRSGMGNNAILTNFTFDNNVGWIDNAISTGSDGNKYVGVTDNLSIRLYNDVTFEYIVYINSLTVTQENHIRKYATEYSVYRTNANLNSNFGGFTNFFNSGDVGRYVHIILQRDSVNNKIRAYKNGILFQEKTSDAFTVTPTISSLMIGQGANTKFRLVRLYNRILTTDEITKNYKQSLPYVNDSLVLYLDATNASGTTWTDLSGNGNNGTLKNFGTSTTSGWNNGALVFDGSDDYVEVLDSASLDLSGNVTVEFVLKKDTITQTETLFEKGDHTGAYNANKEFGVYILNTSNTWVTTSFISSQDTGYIQGSVNNKAGQYEHHVYVKNIKDGIIYLYKNGVLLAQSSISKNPSTNRTEALWIGAKSGTSAYYNFLGAIKSIKVYNKALTSAEVAKNYQDALPRMNANTSGLILSLDARNGYGTQTTWYDGSGSGNNGTLGAFTFNGTTNGWTNDGLLFNGGSVNLNFSNGNIGTGDFTLYTKLKVAKIGSSNWIFDINNGGQVILTMNGDNTIRYANTAIVSTPTVMDGVYFVVVRRTSGITQMYVNNIKQGADYSDTATIDFTTSRIGYLFYNIIYTFGMYNRSLTNAEIKQLYIDQMGFNKSCILSYDFVGGSGTTVVDKLGSGVVGTLKNISSPSTTDSGWVSDGLLLDGVDDYVDFSNTTISPLKEFSVEMVFTWYKNAIGYPSIITSTNFTCYIADAEGGRLYFNGSDGTFATNMIFKPNVKYHFVYTRNANGSKMYVNGKLDVTTTINTLPLDFANFSIAKSANGIKAKFYSFNVYNRSLNDDEVWNRYKESIPEQQYVSNGLVLNLDAEGVSSGTTWNDKSGYGNNATLVGFADPSTSTSGWNKGKLVFDGIDDIVQTNNTYYGTLPLTVEMVATRTSDNTGYLFNIDVPNGVENDGICILYDSANGGMISLLGIGGHATNYKPSLNTPFHLVVTYTSNVVKVYINGKYQSSLSGAYTSITGTTNITIGARYDAGYKFTGSISCVRQYNRTLSDAEILINYNVAMGLPQYVYEGSDYPESLVTLNDIDLSNIKNIKSVNWQPSVNSNDTALAVLSVDSGTTWKSWSGSAWQNVDINNETEMIAKGMTKDVVNAISSANLESLRGTSTKLRFGYYLRTKVLDTVYNNDQFIVTYSDINNSDVTVGQTYNTGTGNTTSFIDATPLNGGLNNYEAVPYDTTNGEGTPITGFILAKPLASELFGVVNYASGTIDYSWSTDNGVNGYKLYITNPDGTTTIRDLTASNYNYSVTQEGMVYAYVTAYIYDEVYGYAESDKSNVVQLETYPINAPSNVTYTFNPDSSSMIIRWTDTNVVEDGFKLNYSIDNATYTEIDIMSTSYSTVGTEYSVEIPLTNINESLKFYIRAYNETGSAINSTSLITLLTKPNYFQVGYVLGYVKYGWIDNTQSEQKYRLFFSIDGGTQQSIDVTSTTVTTEGSIYNVQIAMNTTSTMTSYICAIDSNGRLGIPSAKVDTSFATYHKEPAPSDFKVSWKTVGTAQYTWTCNNQEVIGYKLTYFINEENPTTVDMTCPLNSSAHVMSYEVQLFNDMDKVTAWVQPYTLIDTGLQSDSQSITYIIVNTDAPTNFWKTRTDSGYRFVWDAKNYVDNYEIHYTINQTEYVAHTQYNYYDIQLDPKTTTEFSIYLFANFSTLEVSDHSSTIRFVPVVTKKYAEETKIYTVNQIKGCLDTKISVIRARFVFMDSMNTTNGNIKVIIPRITTKFVQRDASYKAFDAQSTFYSTLTYGKDMMLVKNSTSLINRVNGMTITYGLKRTNGLLTSSLDRNVNRKFSESMWLLNNNVARKSLTSMSISCFNLILAKREIVSVFYTTARSNDALLSTTIWTKLMLEYGLYSEIHKIRICTMGDSITAGHPVYWAETEIDFKPNSGTGNIQSQYQYWLQRRLSDDYEIINNGRGSDTTERMVNRFDRDILPLSPQYCIIQGGTNDITWAVTQNKGDKAYLDNSMEIAKQNILWMVQRCIDNNIVPIIGTLLPRTSISGIYKQALWDFNEWIKAYCNGHEGLYYVDFYNAGKDNIPPTPLEESPVTGNMNPIYDGDSVFDEFGNLVRRGYGIHPNVQGYKLMAEAVPLGIFNALKTGIKVYIDEDCTVEENTDNSDIYHTQYNITFSNIDRGRTKIITRYIKNVGNMPMMYTLYNTSESGVDMTFSLDGVNYTEFVNGLLNNETVNTIYVKIVVPRTGVIPSVQSALSTRSYKVIA